MLNSLPAEEQGLFMSPFLVDNTGYASVPEDTLRDLQDTIVKYYFLYD